MGPSIRYNPFVFYPHYKPQPIATSQHNVCPSPGPHFNAIPSTNDENKEAGSSSSGSYNSEGIENVTIFRQLSILKLGGYWKHLQREDQYGEETTPRQSWICRGKDENKENVMRSHPNIFTTVPFYHEQRDITTDDDIDDDDDDDDDEDDGDDDDDEIEEVDDGCLNGSNSDSFIECAFNTDRVGFVGPFGGFFIHAITEDGWMCSDQLYDTSNKINANDDDQQDKCEVEARQLSTFPLLRLPKKVTALGQEGMYIEDMDLMKRRDNGTIEPCNHRHNSFYDTIFRSSSENLCRRISS